MDNVIECDANTACLKRLLDKLVQLRNDIVAGTKARLNRYIPFFPEGKFSSSATNLASYLALRQFDLCSLQDELARFGLSSLGRSEAYVVDNLDKVIEMLSLAICEKHPGFMHDNVSVSIAEGARLLERRTDELFGPAQANRKVRIMVTLPASAADDYELVRSLMHQGMDCARINCAHDDETTWLDMIDNIHRAEEETGKSCQIVMDLAGQKIRTGKIEPGAAVRHLGVKRDAYGSVIQPARVLLYPAGQQPILTGDAANKPVFAFGINEALFAKLAPGDRLYFTDTRGKRRFLNLVEPTPNGEMLCECRKGAFLAADTLFEWHKKKKTRREIREERIPIVEFSAPPAKIRLYRSDHLLLTKSSIAGKPATVDPQGHVIRPAQIGISHDEIIDMLHPGKTVWIDDGKLGAVVESLTPAGVLLQITHAGPKGVTILEDKGLNFPDTELSLAPLTAKDLKDLDFICNHADLVSYSFVQSKEDISLLLEELKLRNAEHLPIIAKIETQRAVKNLADIILSTIGRAKMGIMIARGDLAVELGSVRLAEIQEEILWLCEAAHVPVIWATQVLETMAKHGAQSRPEITDAAMGVRAECVMLNKGPYIVDTLRILNNILVRMETHQRKKFSRLRALHQWPLELDSPQKEPHSHALSNSPDEGFPGLVADFPKTQNS